MTATEEVVPPAPYVAGPNAVDITPDSDGGVLKEIVKEGVGDAQPAAGCMVTCHYHGTLTDGTVFDSSKDSSKPFQFPLGNRSVIRAWDLGVATMKKGEVAMFTCKSEYAYGISGSPPKIPPNATLIFEITLLSWQEEDLSKAKDGGVLRTQLIKGQGYTVPNDGALCEVHMVGSYNGRQFENRTITFNLGEGSAFGIVEGVERGLEKFKLGEKSRLTVKSKYAYGSGNPELGIPSDATVTFIVELKSFEKERESWDMNSTEKLNQSKMLKEKATMYFKQSKLLLALKFYNKMLVYIESDTGFQEPESTERKNLIQAARLNLGLVHLKLKQYYDAITECNKALEIDQNNVKGLFRRGQAYLEICEPEKAKADFEAVQRIEPENVIVTKQLHICNSKIKVEKEKEKQIYANMFEKFAQKDKEEKGTRFGWWDDEKMQPVVTELEPEVTEDVEEMKRDKRKQLEDLKKRAQAKREELKRLQEEKAANGDGGDVKEDGMDGTDKEENTTTRNTESATDNGIIEDRN